MFQDAKSALGEIARRLPSFNPTGYIRHVTRVVSPGPQQAGGVLLTVSGGRHAGAAVRLATPRFTIGRDLDCDVVLTDTGVESRHLTIEIEPGRLFAKAKIEAIGAVDLLDEAIPAGRHGVALLPATLMIGDATVTLDSTGGGSRRATLTAWTAVAGAAALALFLILPLAWFAMADLPSLTASVPSAARPLSEAKLNDARQRIEVRLAKADLSQVAVLVRPTGLTVKGALGPEAYQRWRSLRADLRTSEPGFAVISDQVTLKSEERAPTHLVGAVSLEPAYVVTADGRKVKTGEPLGEGWVVRAITSGEVVLERGGASAALRY